ncbi:MAG: hypothetical protein ACTSXX_14560 [Candidatus Baldrarchaeia archaeon]
MIIKKLKIEFNIKKNGDRHLKGKIAEEVFKRVFPKLFCKHLTICPTRTITSFLNYFRNDLDFVLENRDLLKNKQKLKLKKEKLRTKMTKFDEELETFREKLGIKRKIEESHVFLSRGCILCGIWRDEIGLCHNCYAIAARKLNRRDFERLKNIVKEIRRLVDIENKLIAIEMAKEDWPEALEVILRLCREDILFLQKVYCDYSKPQPHLPFDFIAVAPDGSEKYLIDVTSTSSGITAGLSPREREVAEEAKKYGFKILVPVIYFGENWTVIVKLKEPEKVSIREGLFKEVISNNEGKRGRRYEKKMKSIMKEIRDLVKNLEQRRLKKIEQLKFSVKE